MIGNKLFRRFYLVTAVVVLIFAVLGNYTAREVIRLSATPREDHHSRAIFFAKLVDHLDPEDRAHGLQQAINLNDDGIPVRLDLIDANGKVIYPPNSGDRLPENWNDFKKPEKPFENVFFGSAVQSLVRFPGAPPTYLYVSSEHFRPKTTSVFYSTFLSLLISVLLGVGFSMVLLFSSLREKATLADSVIAELQSGNLKARFPIRKMDEIGQAMNRFNKMADEIERLVEQVRSVEKSRMTLLQELAHDLRTPVASLRTLLETVSARGSSLEAVLRDELLSLSLREVNYFERLVEDLLVLAQVSEPRYRAEQNAVILNDILEDEISTLSVKTEFKERKIRCINEIDSERLVIQGDAHLLRRMFKNVLDNAFSFAAHAVSLRAEKSAREIKIVISDDGKGFSKEAISSFGVRRISRMINPGHGERLSIGLGSVITKAVAEIHRGQVRVENRMEGERVTGASVEITLPIGNEAALAPGTPSPPT